MKKQKTMKNHIRKIITVILIVSVMIGCSLPAACIADGDGDMYTEYTYYGG